TDGKTRLLLTWTCCWLVSETKTRIPFPILPRQDGEDGLPVSAPGSTLPYPSFFRTIFEDPRESVQAFHFPVSELDPSLMLMNDREACCLAECYSKSYSKPALPDFDVPNQRERPRGRSTPTKASRRPPNSHLDYAILSPRPSYVRSTGRSPAPFLIAKPANPDRRPLNSFPLALGFQDWQGAFLGTFYTLQTPGISTAKPNSLAFPSYLAESKYISEPDEPDQGKNSRNDWSPLPSTPEPALVPLILMSPFRLSSSIEGQEKAIAFWLVHDPRPLACDSTSENGEGQKVIPNLWLIT
ncbi:hypothetical protein STAS_14772, partial [Striga asiatica]